MAQNTNTWMKDLPSTVRSKPLRSLAIPGSHDSGSYFLDTSGPFAPSIPGIVSCLNCCCCGCIKCKVKDWSLTQSVDFGKQLHAGIRYVDIRTAYRADDGNFQIIHGLYGDDLSKVFTQIKEFCDQQPGELIILDFQQFYDFTPALHGTFSSQIDQVFGSSIARASQCDGANSTLDSLESKGFKVVVIYHDTATASNKDYWPSSGIYSPWPNTASASTLIDSLNARFDSLKPDALNVFQAVLSPQASTVILHPCGSLKTTLAVDGNKAVAKWLQEIRQQNRLGFNIIICDYYELSQCATLVRELNELLA